MTTSFATNFEKDSQALILQQSFHTQLGSREKISCGGGEEGWGS